MSETLFDIGTYTRRPKSSFFDYDLDVEVWDYTPDPSKAHDPSATTDELKPFVNSPISNTSEWLTLSEIRRDGGTQPRAFLDLKHVATLVEVLEDGGELDPVTVFYDGSEYWLADGFHRCKAHEDYGQEEINCTITQGTRRDAVLFSVGANASHKAVKPRSREDKRRAVTMLLNDPEWKEWSNVEIAKACKVSHEFVRRLRNDLTSNVASENESTRTYTTKHGTTTKMQTGKIGKKKENTSHPSVEQETQAQSTSAVEFPAPNPLPYSVGEVVQLQFVGHTNGSDMIPSLNGSMAVISCINTFTVTAYIACIDKFLLLLPPELLKVPSENWEGFKRVSERISALVQSKAPLSLGALAILEALQSQLEPNPDDLELLSWLEQKYLSHQV